MPTDAPTAVLAVFCMTLLVISAAFVLAVPDGVSLTTVASAMTPAVFFAAGLIAWRRRPHNRVGMLLLLTGLAIWLTGLTLSSLPLLQTVGLAASTLPLALTLHLLLAFPTGRVRGRPSRFIVLTGYLISTVFELPLHLVGDTAPAVWASDTARTLAAVTGWAQMALGVSSMLGAAVLIARRALSLDVRERRQVEPMVWYRILCCLVIAVTGVAFRTTSEPVVLALLGTIQLLAVTGLPLVFLGGLLFGSFGRTGQVNEMMIRVGTSTPTAAELSQAVAAALGDPDAVVVYARSAGTGYVDEAGHDVPEPDTRTRVIFPARHDGRVVGGILHRPSLVADHAVLDVLAGIVAMAIDQQRLLAEQRSLVAGLQAREWELRSSRRRLLQAEDHERRRIARDLHDGAQQHLVALGLTSRLVSRTTTDPAAARAAGEVADGLVDLLAEFRALIAGIMPAPLVERGLLAAIDHLARRMPMPTRVVVRGMPERLPEDAESTLYFMVSEALTNVIKHASADAVDVTLEMVGTPEVPRVAVTVADDGAGGADLSGGTGLRGLADRVATLGGTLRVESTSGSGCSVRAEIPCG
ncbi:MAG: histidine kinase [Humibacillus sp.]|nr:histidine kinase [Humibacillus sp.]MDN5779728.1 histidine kinase [Humibacillus sp.]